MADLAARRKALVQTSMDNIKRVINDKGVNRDALEEVRAVLVNLASQKDVFANSEFPAPRTEEVAKIYLITDDEGGDFTLYLVSAQPRGPSPVHNHGTFAVIAGMEGEEANTIYKRLDDGSEPGKARLGIDREVVLKAGDSLAFMPRDIHRVQVVSTGPTRHFHLYGKGFDQQTDRLRFNLRDGTTAAVGGSFTPVDESRRVL